MALSISPTQTVLWDQFRYTGSPAEFAWVLPIKPGARIELASDAWFDVLEAATAPKVEPPALDCSAQENAACSVTPAAPVFVGGCGESGMEGGDGYLLPDDAPVSVVSRESAGPYEAVILRAEEPDALPRWLEDHGYPIPDEVKPTIEAYVEEGFDFVALRLLPGAGVQQMKPVRVVQSGAVPVLPLRMVAAGTGARTAITLFVVGEGRYAPTSFPATTIPDEVVRWDFGLSQSNYSGIRDAYFDREGASTWLTSYAVRGALFGEVANAVTGLPRMVQTTNGWRYTRLSDAYVQQAFAYGETSANDCMDLYATLGSEGRRVVDPCDEDGTCRGVDPSTEVDVAALGCDPPIGSDKPLDDLAVALVGQHPRDVWVTRLEANLGRTAFATDLELGAAEEQEPVSGTIAPAYADDAPCPLASAPPSVRDDDRKRAARLAIGGVLGAVAALAAGRRLARRPRAAKAVKA